MTDAGSDFEAGDATFASANSDMPDPAGVMRPGLGEGGFLDRADPPSVTKDQCQNRSINAAEPSAVGRRRGVATIRRRRRRGGTAYPAREHAMRLFHPNRRPLPPSGVSHHAGLIGRIS